MEEITKQELKKRVGVRSDATLRNWMLQGLLPEPVIKTGRSGRGTEAYYPVEVEHLCREVKRLTREGKDLHEIRTILMTAGASARAASKETRRKRKAGKTGAVDLGARQIWIADRMAKESKKLARIVRDTRTPQLITDELIQNAAQLASEGHAPVLVIGSEKSFIMADYATAEFFANQSETEAVLMVPLRHLFKEELENATRALAPNVKASVTEYELTEKGRRKVGRAKQLPVADENGSFQRYIVLP